MAEHFPQAAFRMPRDNELRSGGSIHSCSGEPMTDDATVAWRYEVQHGPDGETNYAWVYDENNNLVCTAKTHHAMAIVDGTRLSAPVEQAGEVAAWRYEIKHGPDGEANYAWVYDEKNNLVCTAKTHHAAAIVQKMRTTPQPTPGFAEGFEACREACKQIARDHTPAKFEGTLAAHVTGTKIESAIAALQSPAALPAPAGKEVTVEQIAFRVRLAIIDATDKVSRPQREAIGDAAACAILSDFTITHKNEERV
jgi:hypothetical protein